MKVVVSEQARVELREIALFIARDNASRARSFVRELRSKAYEIAQTPEAFPVVPRFAKLGIRRRVFRNYLIFYRLQADTVNIIHILHGAQDHERLPMPD